MRTLTRVLPGPGKGPATRASATLLAFMTFAACGGAERNATALVVNVQSELRAPDIDAVVVTLVVGDRTSTRRLPVDSGTPFPLQLGVVPRGKPDYSVEITAAGVKGDTVLVEQSARVSFVPNDKMQLTLLLLAACQPMPCSADANTTCTTGGACVQRSELVTLAPYPGPSGEDAGADAAGPDAPPSLDAGLPDARPIPGRWVEAREGLTMDVILAAVHPVAENDVWAAGARNGVGVAFRFDGTSWKEVPTPFPSLPPLAAVWANDARDIWFGGGRGTILNFGAGQWTNVANPVRAAVAGLWGSPSTGVFAVGAQGSILRIRNGQITREESGNQQPLLSVWGGAIPGAQEPGAVIAVGAAGMVLIRQDGTWIRANANSNAILYGVWASSAGEAWAVGDGEALRFSRGHWTRFDGGQRVAVAVWGSSLEDVWSAGSDGTRAGVSYFDGASWRDAPSPAGMFITSLLALRGRTPLDVWAVGPGFAMRLVP
jgi:hypothetical protein